MALFSGAVLGQLTKRQYINFIELITAKFELVKVHDPRRLLTMTPAVGRRVSFSEEAEQ
jgi:hypothetical protein